jgi:glycosyltransferase involved in cell wall biosynthesis
MEREIVQALVGADVHTVEVPGFIRRERYDAFQHIAPDLGGRRVLSIANGPGGFRAWYKGLDVMTAAVRRVRERQPDVVLDIVGNWTPDVVRQYEGPGIAFYEDVRDLVPYLRGAALYIQCGRGDAFAVAVLEAMLAGLPAVVSDLTGAREAVAEVASWLVVPSDGDAVAAAVERYLALSLAEREALSRRARAVAAGFSEERALEAVRRGFEGLLERTGGNGAVAR